MGSQMNLTSQQQALLDGAKGPAMAKVVKTLVMYGECFGAERMVPVTGANGHLVTRLASPCSVQSMTSWMSC